MKALLLVVSILNSVTVPQDSVLPVYGCGASCRREIEQLSLPIKMDDGWIRVKVRRRTWVNKCNYETKKCVDEPASGRAGPSSIDLWLFADCKESLFAASSNPDRSDASEQNVFHEDGTPKFQTVYGNPFIQWAKLCPAEGKDGMRFIHESFQQIRKNLKSPQNDSPP